MISKTAVEAPGRHDHKACLEDIKEAEWNGAIHPVPGSVGTATKTFISPKPVIPGQCKCSEDPPDGSKIGL